MPVRLGSVLRVIAILVGGALAGWVSIGVTLTLSLGQDRPELARFWWPWGAVPKAALAQRILTVSKPSAAMLDDSVRLATEAAQREPVLPGPVRTLAAIADYRGQRERARTLFRVAEALTRRDKVTQLWLIEDSVSRGDAHEAILHYNRAMLVSPALRATLMPIVVNAAANADILRELLPLIAKRPLWWKDYIRLLATDGTNVDALEASARALRLNIVDSEERSLAEGVLARIVELKAYRRAAGLAASLLKAAGMTALPLQSGDFEIASGVYPFAWWMRDQGSVRAYRDSVPRGGVGLWLVATTGASGEVARQLMVLPVGSHALTGIAGNVSSERLAQPIIEITCADGALLGRFSLPPAGDEGQDFRFAFTVPASNCDAQWLRISTAPAVDTQVWLDDLKIVSAGRR